jgi:lysophospholipase L1-like esterase
MKIAMFGGSTMWGSGVRDAFTIPSILAKELQNHGVVCEIINFGEGGYVSTQEVITLLLHLQQGHIPDLVIFYDGINDTFSAYQQHVAGLPQNEFNRVKEFNLSLPENFKQRIGVFFQAEVRRLSTMRFLKDLLQRSGVWSKGSAAAPPLLLDIPASESELLAHEVFRTYMGNIDLVKALGEHYYFKYLFYWQPTIFQKIHLTEYEKGQRSVMSSAEQFFQKTYQVMQQGRLAEKSGEHFHDLSLIFSDVQEPVYTDWIHLGELGNEIIAKKMAHDVLEVIAANKGTAEH